MDPLGLQSVVHGRVDCIVDGIMVVEVYWTEGRPEFYGLDLWGCPATPNGPHRSAVTAALAVAKDKYRS